MRSTGVLMTKVEWCQVWCGGTSAEGMQLRGVTSDWPCIMLKPSVWAMAGLLDELRAGRRNRISRPSWGLMDVASTELNLEPGTKAQFECRNMSGGQRQGRYNWAGASRTTHCLVVHIPCLIRRRD